MWFEHCLILCAALTASAVKVDVQGSLTLGSQVAEFLKQQLEGEIDSLNGRRAMTDAMEELVKVVRHMKPCKKISICPLNFEKLLIDYVSDLTTGVKSVFDGVLADELCKVKYFQKCLKHVKKVVNKATSDNDDVYRWINVLKKISGVYLEQAILLTKQGLVNAEKKEQASNALKQQLVFKITDVERNYMGKLCKDFSFCPYQFDATIYLQLLLNLMKNMKDSDVNIFLRQFKRIFLSAPMFIEDDLTRKNFEKVLEELLQNETIVAKDIILSISEVVQQRLAVVESKGRDTDLLQMMLSDMDHLYVNNRDEHIEQFLNAVKAWLKSNDIEALGSGMAVFYNNLASHLSNQPSEIVFKLKTEAQVFLALTAINPTTALG